MPVLDPKLLRVLLLAPLIPSLESEQPAPPPKPAERIGVIAGNYEQFRRYLRDGRRNPRDYFYISKERDLCGRRDFTLVKVGDWWRNPAASAVGEAIHTGRITSVEYADD